MNTEVPYQMRSFGITQASFGHLVGDQGVGGSNPLSPTNLFQQLLSHPQGILKLWCPSSEDRHCSIDTMAALVARIAVPPRAATAFCFRTQADVRIVTTSSG